jgi:hypothetical protein
MAASALWIAGCAPTAPQMVNGAAPPSIEQVQYYPYQVKGYQSSYPARRILILLPTDIHRPPVEPGITAALYNGDVPIGSSEGTSGQTVLEFYAAQLAPTVQDALKQSAHEAGLISTTSPTSVYQPTQDLKVDYVMESRIAQFWVTKKVGPGGDAGPAWFTEADVALDVTIYKPPFTVPFWQGSGTATYEDPPIDNPNATPDDETAIYDQPGEVLSVAMTRAVASVFSRTDLHALVIGDQMTPRY